MKGIMIGGKADDKPEGVYPLVNPNKFKSKILKKASNHIHTYTSELTDGVTKPITDIEAITKHIARQNPPSPKVSIESFPIKGTLNSIRGKSSKYIISTETTLASNKNQVVDDKI